MARPSIPRFWLLRCALALTTTLGAPLIVQATPGPETHAVSSPARPTGRSTPRASSARARQTTLRVVRRAGTMPRSVRATARAARSLRHSAVRLASRPWTQGTAQQWYFDLDGTVLNSKLAMLESIGLAAEAAGFSLSESQVTELASGAPFDALFPRVCPTALPLYEAFVAQYNRILPDVSARVSRAYPEAHAALEELARVVAPSFRAGSATPWQGPFGLATAQAKPTAKRALETAGLAKFFQLEAIVGTSGIESEVRPKPAPDSLHAAAAGLRTRHGARRVTRVYVGDSPHDITAAHNAGFESVAVHSDTHGYGEIEAILSAAPGHLVPDLSKLPSIAREIDARHRAAGKRSVATPRAAARIASGKRPRAAG